ncbi:Folliculin [Penicillium sp. IBT 35674x]|nr:Folliculin [Penicillium sp. IBT 35674x]
MDFLLSLTHFCEVHGPTSIICSQVTPVACSQCHPDADHSPDNSPSNSPRPKSPNTPATAEFNGSKVEKIEDHPYFMRPQPASPEERNTRAGSVDGDTCASCSLSLPEGVSKQLPSPSRDGKSHNGSPVLRSREVVYSCGNNHCDSDDHAPDPHAHASPPDSLHSSSIASDSSCYTIAYIFRLPDPMARGKRRSYALVALAGKDAGRAFRACPVIWRAFGRIATGIVSAAERFQEEEKKREEQANPRGNSGGRQFTPVSSFLTGRAFDPTGQPRRLGQIRARNLAEIVGNEYIFTEIHAHFVALLQQLGSMFGGVPISDERYVCSTVGDEETTGASQPVLVSAAARSKRNSTATKYDGNDIDMSKLDISGPKPIPINARRPVVA